MLICWFALYIDLADHGKGGYEIFLKSLTARRKSSLFQGTSIRRSVIERINSSEAIIRSVHNLSRYEHNLLSLIFQELFLFFTSDGLFLLMYDLSCNVKLHFMFHFVSSTPDSNKLLLSLKFMMIVWLLIWNQKSRMSFSLKHMSRVDNRNENEWKCCFFHLRVCRGNLK